MLKNIVLASAYLLRGKKPWSMGYAYHRDRYIQKQLQSRHLLAAFASAAELPRGYGVGFDERVIEYGWLLSRLANQSGIIFDAGAALNHKWILTRQEVSSCRVLISTLAPEPYVHEDASVSYIYGDLRETLLRDGCMDAISCVSTLEHVGMDNTLLYTDESQFSEQREEDYLKVVRELRRLSRPGGRTLITVPFGRSQRHRWFQQFTPKMLENIISAFGPSAYNNVFYRYSADGWHVSTSEACQDAEYADIHLADYRLPADRAAAARAVACIELTCPTNA